MRELELGRDLDLASSPPIPVLNRTRVLRRHPSRLAVTQKRYEFGRNSSQCLATYAPALMHRVLVTS